MTKGIVALKLYRKNAAQLHALSTAVSIGFTAQVTIFPTPSPAIATLDTANVALLAAIDAWGEVGNRGSHEDWLTLQDKIADVRVLLIALAQYAQNVTTDRTLLASIGWELKGAKSPSVLLPAVENLKQVFPRNLSRRFLKLKWERPLNTKPGDVSNYAVFRAETNVFSDAEMIDTVTKTSFVDMDPGSGINYYWILPCNTIGQGTEMMIVASTSAIM